MRLNRDCSMSWAPHLTPYVAGLAARAMSGHTSPEDSDPEGFEHAVPRDDGNAFVLALGGEHPVEGIPIGLGESPRTLCLGHRDGQLCWTTLFRVPRPARSA